MKPKVVLALFFVSMLLAIYTPGGRFYTNYEGELSNGQDFRFNILLHYLALAIALSSSIWLGLLLRRFLSKRVA